MNQLFRGGPAKGVILVPRFGARITEAATGEVACEALCTGV